MSRSTPGLLACPVDMVCDAVGNIWIADCEHRAVIGIDGRGEVIARVDQRSGRPADHPAGGSARDTEFIEPRGLALAPDGNTLYVLDAGAGAVYQLDVKAVRESVGSPGESPGKSPGAVSIETVMSGLEMPRAVVVDQEAGWLYVAAANDDRIRRIAMGDGANGVTVHGGRTFEAVLPQGGLGRPEHMALSSDRRRLYVVDGQPRSVRVIDLMQRDVSTLVTLPEALPQARSDAGPETRPITGNDNLLGQGLGLSIAVTPAGLMVADPMAGMLYGINPRHGTVVPMWRGHGVSITLANTAASTDRPPTTPEVVRPVSVAFDRMTRSYIVADPGNHRLLRVSRDAQSTTVLFS